MPTPTHLAEPGLSPLIRTCALLGAACVLGMLGIFIATGIGQDPLQYVHPVPEYTALLLRDPQTLKWAIGLDNAFVVFYSTMFLALAAKLWRDGHARPLVAASLALLMLTGLLDTAENMHFLSMISSAQAELPITAAEIQWQVWESLVKFHVSYLGLFLLGFALPTQSLKGRVLGFLARWVQWPIGMLIYVVPAELVKPLVFGRFTFFLVAHLLLAALYWQHANDSSEPR